MPRLLENLLSPFRAFVRREASGGIVLLVATALALLWANIPGGAHSYAHFWETQLGFGLNGLHFERPLHFWINEGLMAVFFFVVGLEVKREVLSGALSTFKKAALPIFGAFGGMLVPALLFLLCAGAMPYRAAWGTPIATDIAFALGILSLAGKRVPFGLYMFLAALAIADDIGAVLVIAFFYTGAINLWSLGAAAALLLALWGINRLGVRALPVYTFFGVFLWYAVYRSGVHASLSGVLLALFIPARALVPTEYFIASSRRKLNKLENVCASSASHEEKEEKSQRLIYALEENCERTMTPLGRIMDSLHAWVAYLIMPLFALANAGIAFSSGMFAPAGRPLLWGIGLGLVLGKPIGIFLFSWLAVKLRAGALPKGASFKMLAAIACLGGIGFTMSIFIATLSLPDPAALDTAKLGVLCASATAGIVGLVALRRV